ncbi:MAG TPA: hypothetical protein VGD36_16485 [Xanthobacteraceae bacterium]
MRTFALGLGLLVLCAASPAQAAELRVPVRPIVPVRLISPQPARVVPAVAPKPEPQNSGAKPAAAEPPPAVAPAPEPENAEPSWIERFGPFIKSQLDSMFTGSVPPQTCAAGARPPGTAAAATCMRPIVKRRHARSRGAERRFRRPG